MQHIDFHSISHYFLFSYYIYYHLHDYLSIHIQISYEIEQKNKKISVSAVTFK